jgi:4-amino-4-deoxy-L-arabinose transferase-like glycosyltransferase
MLHNTREPQPQSSDAGKRLRFVGVALGLYAFGILSIGLTRDWQLRNEDNGAMQTTLALSHRQLGLASTRAHDQFVRPQTGEATPYGHHPPAIALVLAGAFALAGSDSPAVARLTVIVFHLGSVFLLTTLLAQFFDIRRALLGGFVMATLPMSGYFGRMVNYEPVCLFGILAQLYGYVQFKRTGRRRGLLWLSLGVVGGGLIDWPSFFFAAALALVETIDLVQRRSPTFTLLGVLVASAAAVFLFDLWHLWYAARGSMQALFSVASSTQSYLAPDFTVGPFVFGQIDTFRRYFTEIGLISILLAGVCLVRPHIPLSRSLFDVADAPVLKRLLLAAGTAALAYVLAAPDWAAAHQYWQFYFLPAVVMSILLLWGLLQRAIAANSTRLLRGLRVVCILDVIIASGYWLHFRHTRIEAYAVEATAKFRSTFLSPQSFHQESGGGKR